MSHIRVVLAEDHESVREGFRALFAAIEDIELVGEAGNFADAVTVAHATSPDVIVMDLSMPVAGGLDALRRIKGGNERCAVVVMSRHTDPAFVRAALAGGALGYISKQSPFSELINGIRAAARGEQYLDPRLPPALPGTTRDRTGVSPHLSGRELEVLRRTAAGHSNKEIGGELGISVKTVEAHKANAMRKLRLKDRAGVVRYGMLQGWLSE